MGQRIEHVPVESVYALRQAVLRPGGTLEDCIWEGDGSATHMAILDGREPVCIASFYNRPFGDSDLSVQLRGMATHQAFRGMGLGKALVLHAIDYYKSLGYDMIWCNSREVAVDFYRKLGFMVVSDAFEVDGVGTHYRMSCNLVS